MTNPPSNPFKSASPSDHQPLEGGLTEGLDKDRERAFPAELLQAQRQLGTLSQEVGELRSRLAGRTHQMGVLQQVAEILAVTPKVAQVASVVQGVFVQEFGAKSCVVWIMEDSGTLYQVRAGYGVPRSLWSGLELPAPNPFPEAPIVLYQDQWLERSVDGGLLDCLRLTADTDLYFVPFESQLLLMGFAIVGLESGLSLEEEEHSLTIFQRQVAVSIYNAWLFRDLAEQRDALRRQTSELEKANADLREADRFRSEFLALTSHELRTPLTGILGFTRLVMDGLYEDEDEMLQMLADSYASGRHLLDLLNDILDLAKIESGRMQIDIEPWSLPVLLEEVRALVQAYPRQPGVELCWPSDLAGLPEALVDPGRLKQVLINLVSNSLKFTKQGSVTVQVERSFGVIAIAIVDTGIGVTLEAQGHLFQKFVQADGGHAREYGGTGLGLVICKRLMEMMNGTIALFSEGEGQGTTLTLTVPIA